MTKTTEARWRGLIEAQERSGLSAREFADLQGITLSTLYWWRSRLRRDTTELVPVEVVSHQMVASGAERATAPFELSLDDSVTLRVHPGFDEAELRRLLRALRC
jgi:transposase